VERLGKIQRDARAETDKKLVADLQAELQQARFLQGQALKAMKDLTPKEAVKIATALNIGWKHELLILGDPTERTSNIQEIIRGEYERWAIRDEEPDTSSAGNVQDLGEDQ